MEMCNEPPPPTVQEVIANAEQPNRADLPDSIDEQVPNERRSQNNRDRGRQVPIPTKEKTQKCAEIDVRIV